MGAGSGPVHARPDTTPIPEFDAIRVPDFAGEWFTELVGRAINGVGPPGHAGVPDSAA